MGCLYLLPYIAVIGLIFVVVRKLQKYFKIPPVPKLDEIWWSERHGTIEDNTIEPFTINISDEVIIIINNYILK